MLTVRIAPDPQIELWKLSCGETFVHNNKLYIYAYIKGETLNNKNKLPAINLENGELVRIDKLNLVTPVNVDATIELKCFSDIHCEETAKAYKEKGYNPFNDNFSVESCEEALVTDF